jgi:hypothetical protein
VWFAGGREATLAWMAARNADALGAARPVPVSEGAISRAPPIGAASCALIDDPERRRRSPERRARGGRR